MFDLAHHPLVGLIGQIQPFGDQAVQTGPLELGEPALRDFEILGRRRDVDRWAGAAQDPLE